MYLALKLDKYNDIYVAGYGNVTLTTSDCITIKYLSDGFQQWITTTSNAAANDVFVDNILNVYVTGFAGPPSTAITIKYSQPNGIQQISSIVPKEFKLEQNYPNPFNPSTKLKFQISKFENIKIVIYDILGQEVIKLVNEKLKPGTYEFNWKAENLPTGIYFYKLISENYIETRKAVLIK